MTGPRARRMAPVLAAANHLRVALPGATVYVRHDTERVVVDLSAEQAVAIAVNVRLARGA